MWFVIMMALIALALSIIDVYRQHRLRIRMNNLLVLLDKPRGKDENDG